MKVEPQIPSRDPSNSSNQSLEKAPDHVATAVAIAEDMKAEELRLLDLAEVSDFTDYFLIMSGRSDRQVQAIGGAIDRRLRERGVRPLHREGLREGKWVLLDYGDLVIHVFDQERRGFYRLDLLWSDAPELVCDVASGQVSRAPSSSPAKRAESKE